ncbi:hypothetical protein [Pelagibacterium montanilacus]|uniref:hypothetical protein n=1 Tax=Pelagibacterium montanilacus TaxID=2185280 RepID=UPI000F8D10A8|nr:hypothetical protein [Pelagibacterium montanilacus]
MTRTLIATLLAGATLLVTGCANSVINDPEEMARRHAEVARNQAAWDDFWGGGTGSGGSAVGSTTTSSAPAPLPSVRTQAPRRCYQTSATHQTCFD